MKIHTTNYYKTFIEVAEDCPVTAGKFPPTKINEKSVASIQFEIINQNPYRYTSDDVIFHTYAIRNNLTESDLPKARESFFSKGQPCFRASPLTKRYGWGVHSDEEGKIALFGVETEAYSNLSKDKTLKIIKALRTSKA